MNTFIAGKIQYHYNPDLSGDVILQHPGGTLVINGDDFLDFIADVVRKWKIRDLEDMGPDEVLGLITTKGG